MPASKYSDAVRLSQRWPRALLAAVEAAADERGWNATQWLQDAAKSALNREKRKARAAAPYGDQPG